jgi:predicted GNAT superfamily acetyltransferase
MLCSVFCLVSLIEQQLSSIKGVGFVYYAGIFINVESSLKFGLVKFAVYFQRVAPLQLSIDRISWTCNYLVSIILAVNYHRLQCCARKDYLYVDMYQY